MSVSAIEMWADEVLALRERLDAHASLSLVDRYMERDALFSAAVDAGISRVEISQRTGWSTNSVGRTVRRARHVRSGAERPQKRLGRFGEPIGEAVAQTPEEFWCALHNR